MKTVAELIEERRDGELEYVKKYIRKHGGDGLCCPDECGCGIDDIGACGESYCDLDCVPAKGEMGEWEGIKCMVYYVIEKTTEATDETK